MRAARFDNIPESEVTKIYVKDNEVTAFDTQLFHIRLENMARSKVIDSLMKKLNNQRLDGTLQITCESED